MALDFASKIRRIKSVAGSGTVRLLDVGCGKGFFVSACVREGIDAGGIDLSATAVEYAERTLKVPVRQGRLEDYVVELGPVDVVTFWATIEHLPDPLATLRAIRQVLNPGGHLFLDTGVAGDLLDRLLPGRVQWYDPPQHLWVFSVQGIRQALLRCGFVNVQVDPCFERSAARKVIRIGRNLTTAVMLRLSATIGRLRAGPFEFTRFPMGNLMFVHAEVPEQSIA